MAAFAMAAGFFASPVSADGWSDARKAEFTKWHTQHPAQEAGVANLKAKTAAMIRAYTPPAAETALQAPPVIWKVSDAPTAIWDAPEAPKLTVIPAGEFTMGSPASEAGRSENETQRRIRIGYPLAVGTYDVTRAEFAAFVAETNYDPKGDGCNVLVDKKFITSSNYNWQKPGFDQTDNDPVVCVDWNAAKAYVNWLSQKTGHSYRLLSETEWEYAARAGTTTARFWGENPDDGCSYANLADQTARAKYSDLIAVNCRDGFVFTAPVGSFKPNAFGLYDMLGNVWQWGEDCWTGNSTDLPTDGSALEIADCHERVERSASWGDPPSAIRAARRYGHSASVRDSLHGFRVARVL
jgi:formylglycine-generating enzyme required for sulfatase activity